MRVLQVIPDLGVGGAERVVVDLATALRRCGDDVRVLSLYSSKGTHLEHELREANVPIEFGRKKTGFDCRMFRVVHDIIRSFRPQVVHTHLYVLRYAVPQIVLRPRVAKVHTIHTIAEREVPRGSQIVHQLAFRTGVHPVAISREVQRSVGRTYGVASATTILNGLRVERFGLKPAEQGRDWRRANGVDPDAMLLLCVARLSREKNVAALISAMAREELRRIPRLQLVVVGDGILRTELERQASNLQVGDRCVFLGRRHDVPDIMAATDALVMPSLWEGGPLSVVEAMASGLPVVATDVGAVRDMVVDGETGVIVPPGDDDRLVGALAWLCNNPEARRRMGESGLRRASTFLSVDAMADAYRRLYRELVAARQHSPSASL